MVTLGTWPLSTCNPHFILLLISVVAEVSFRIIDDIILEGNPEDNALICINQVTPSEQVVRTIDGNILVSDIGNAVESKEHFFL